jgi:hypothetical protein
MQGIFSQSSIRVGSAFVSLLIGLSFLCLLIWDEYAPLSTHDHNKLEAARINLKNPDDFTFAVFADHKRNRTVLDPILKDINRGHEISFAIDIGDMVPQGSRRAFRRLLRIIYEYLKIPLLTAIGNHDLDEKGGGSTSYKELFGPTYYTFQIGQGDFIVLESVGTGEFDRVQFQWLEEWLQKSQPSKYRFVFIHAPPFDPRGDGFHKCLPEKDGKDLMELFRRYHVTHLFASHIHGYFSGIREGVPYTITGGAGARLDGKDPEHFFYHYLRVHVVGGKAEVAVIHIKKEEGFVGFLDLVEDLMEENIIPSFLLPASMFFLMLSGFLLFYHKHCGVKKPDC